MLVVLIGKKKQLNFGKTKINKAKIINESKWISQLLTFIYRGLVDGGRINACTDYRELSKERTT